MKIYFGLFHTLGDVIVSTALIRAIKEKYPDSEITYAVGQDYVHVLAGNPDITNIIPTKHPWEIVFRSKEHNYDKVYLPLMLTQEDTLWHQRPPYCMPGERHNLIDMYADKCEDDLVINTRKTFLYPEDSKWDEIVASAGDKSKEFSETPFITMHTTSRNPSKDWPHENFVALAKMINEKYGNKFNIYQIGKDDKVIGEPTKCLNGLELPHTMALIKRSKLHIDIDSGPSFIADSLDVPLVCIMGASDHNTSGPIGPNVAFIEPVRKCIGTATHCPCVTRCLINDDCIKTISPKEVFEIVDRMLSKIFG